MAIYGDMLSFFPEQFQWFDYFSMLPNPVASYQKRESLGKIKGIIQFVRNGELKQEGYALSDIDIPTLWTRAKLKAGNFIGIDEDVYRIVKPDSWTFQGGFNIYILETVNGNTDQQEPNIEVDFGTY